MSNPTQSAYNIFESRDDHIWGEATQMVTVLNRTATTYADPSSDRHDVSRLEVVEEIEVHNNHHAINVEGESAPPSPNIYDSESEPEDCSPRRVIDTHHGVSPPQYGSILDLEPEPDLFETEPIQWCPGFADDDSESDEDDAALNNEALDLGLSSFTPLLRLNLVQALKCHLPPFPSAPPPPPNSPLICPICFVAPLTHPTTVTLPCAHAFCAPCLRSWVVAAHTTSSEPSCPLCRGSLSYACGHNIPPDRLVGGAQFTYVQLSSSGCGDQSHKDLEVRRRWFLGRVCAGRRPFDPEPSDVTPELLEAAAAYLGSWRIGAVLLQMGLLRHSLDLLEMGLGELERHVENVGRFAGVVARELGIVEEKLADRDGDRPLSVIERVALGHMRCELRRVERKLRRSARRTRFRMEAVREYFSGLVHWLGSGQSSYACRLRFRSPKIHGGSMGEDYEGGTAEEILRKAEEEFCSGECNGYIRALIFNNLVRRAGLSWKPVLHDVCECAIMIFPTTGNP
ncbi:hypothetical protein F4775DRAFT_489086 [Biscogniauxia sp. FL1348]|nr:hypothetical protein F4775DRAFT_489086 [Biscogniauxia sp. FL1348]